MMSSSSRLCTLAVFLTLALWSAAPASADQRETANPELFHFPYVGGGDPEHSFHHPYHPGPTDDPISGWLQLGTATVARSHSGRDVVRLTSSSQANQGLLYNGVRTASNNFNGYFDVQMDSVRESHESADGMGFFFSRDRPRLGSAMGITHTFEGLGLIIDTFSNSRTRQVPYLYAYISDGRKEWNPDTDGSDTEITRGCQLEMNTQIRIYVQYLDENLHVGVAMNPRSPQRWHTCFKANNVRLPFSGGGYFSFAGETGHFFAMHEVHDALFVDEHSRESEHHSHEHDWHETEHVAHGQPYDNRHEEDHDHQKQHHENHASRYETNPDPKSRVHEGTTASESMSGSLDLQVYEVFNSLQAAMRGMGDHNIEDTKTKLNGVRDLTAELVKEIEKQKKEMGNLIATLTHLKHTSGDLTFASDRFQSQLRGLHGSIRTLHERTEDVSDSHDDLHHDLERHQEELANKRSHGLLVMFLVIQIMLVGGVYMVNKVTTSSRKIGRMV